MKAFYFSNETKTLGNGDNRNIIVGDTHKVDCVPKICRQGLHGSINVLDTLQYANSSNLYLVDITGEVNVGKDKICGQKRKYLRHCNIESVLLEFARKQAQINIHKIKPHCSDKDYKLIKDYLRTGNEDLKHAARTAAESIAWVEELSAARAAALAAAWSTAVSAAETAARTTAEAAVLAAAWSAKLLWSWAKSDARLNANKMITDMIRKETGWDI